MVLASLATFPVTAQAQSGDTPDPAPDAPAAAPSAELPGGLNMGQKEANTGVGSTYQGDVIGDWTLQCVRAPEGQSDPCEMVQLLKDGGGNPIVEMRVFPLPAGGQAAAGATVITPLETLLTQPLRLSVDGSAAKRYPYSWCSRIGCVARIGFSAGEIDTFKRGAKGTLGIVPAAAPDNQVALTVSLTGFTKAWETVSANVQGAEIAAPASE